MVFLKSSKAFSLIEVLIVLFIIAFLFGLAAQKFSRRDQKINNTFDRIIRLNRRLVMLSKFYNETYRLVIQLDADGPEKYWVEKKQAKKDKDDASSTIERQDDTGKEEISGFIIDSSFYDEPQVILPFLSITKVESSPWKEDKTEGLAYIYYYPKGLAQETALQFLRPDNQGRWTLYLDPVTKSIQVLKKTRGLVKKR